MYFAEIEFKALLLLSIHFSHAFGNADLQYEKCLMTDPEAHWIDQPVDHFNAKDTRTFKMRYLTYNDYFKPNGPIVIELEEMIVPCYKFSEDFANETNAIVIQPEHRYHRYSIPLNVTPDSPVDDFKYLTTRQHLGDIAHLVEVLKQAPEYRNSKVLVIGNKDSGNIAVWLRMLYPDLVDAAVAGSAPLLAKVDVDQYLEKIGDSYKKYGYPGCYENIAKNFKRYGDLLKTANGTEQLKKEENICNDTDMTRPENIVIFHQLKMIPLINSVELGGIMLIKLRCVELQPETILWKNKRPCHSISYDSLVEGTKHSLQFFAMQYQKCNEFGHFVTTTSDNQIFGKHIPIEFLYKFCTDVLGHEFNEQRVTRGVAERNKLYGGLRPNVTNVVFVTGDMDPDITLEVVKNLTVTAPSISIPDYSGQRFLLLPPSTTKKLQEDVRELIKKWFGLIK